MPPTPTSSTSTPQAPTESKPWRDPANPHGWPVPRPNHPISPTNRPFDALALAWKVNPNYLREMTPVGKGALRDCMNLAYAHGIHDGFTGTSPLEPAPEPSDATPPPAPAVPPTL